MCLAAPSLPLLVTGRALQGIGAAMLTPNSLAILGAAFKSEDRGRAIGIWAAAGAAASAVGPLLGGWLIGAVGWRSIFLINVPIGAASIALAVRYLDDDPVESKPPLDVLGAGLIAAALLALTWSLTVASDQKGVSVETACVLGAGGLLIVGFLYVEKSYGEAAMMPLSLFGSASFIGLTLLTPASGGHFSTPKHSHAVSSASATDWTRCDEQEAPTPTSNALRRRRGGSRRRFREDSR
jgi:MFS family permease